MARIIKKIDFVEERSHQAREVLGKAPVWVIRWGTTVMFLIILSLIALSWIIKYPDIVPGRIIITTPRPPVSVMSRSNGKIAHLLVADNELIQSEELLAVIDNPANTDDVIWLKNKIQKFETANPNSLSGQDSILSHANLKLGELQAFYASFYRSYQNFQLNENLRAIDKKKEMIALQIEEYESLKKTHAGQKKLIEEEESLITVSYERNKSLLGEGLIAKDGLEKVERELLEVRKNGEALNTAIAQTSIDVSKLKKQLVDLEIQKEEDSKKLFIDLMEQYKNLSGKMAEWEQQYLLKAPVGGRVSFVNVWSKDQFVKTGEEVMAIIPEEAQQIIGRVVMSINNSGKVKVGQKVNVLLDSYPYQEFGVVEGSVKSIALVPRNDTYAIEVKLLDELNTSYGKKIDFRQELQGSVEIITEDIRFLQRVFYQLRKLAN